MGCWNKTCGVSQFPLMSGDDVVTFILIQNSFHVENHPTYIGNNGWSSIPVPFFGQYNDYGWMEGGNVADETVKLDYIKSQFGDKVIANPDKAKRSELCYPNLKSPFDNIESIGDTIHGDVFHIKSSRGDGKTHYKMAGFMVSKIIWDKLTDRNLDKIVKTIKKFIKFAEAKPAKVYTMEEKSATMTEYIDLKKKLTPKNYTPTPEETARLAELKAITDEIIDDSLNSYEMKLDKFIEKHVKAKYWWYDPGVCAIKSIFTNYNYSADSGMAFPIHQLLTAGVIDVECAARLYNFYSAMSSLRKQFSPQVGEGSQEGYSEVHDLLIAGMTEMKKTYEDWCKAEYGEDGE